MQKLPCHGDWLIDYADKALEPEQLPAAEQHLTGCATCQRELAALQTSGQRLTGYFATLRRTEHCSVPHRRDASRWTTIAQRAAAVAACLALIAMSYWLNRQAQIDVDQPLTTHHSPLTTPDQPLTTHHSPLTPPSPLTTHNSPLTPHPDILAEITRETQIARLRATIEILDDQPGMSERSASLRQYLSEAYQVEAELPSM